MDASDERLTTLLSVPDRAPDLAFADAVALRVAAERALATRLAADRARTATLLVATAAVAAGLWLFARVDAFAAASGPAGGGAWTGLAVLAAAMLLWLGSAGAGGLATD